MHIGRSRLRLKERLLYKHVLVVANKDRPIKHTLYRLYKRLTNPNLPSVESVTADAPG